MLMAFKTSDISVLTSGAVAGGADGRELDESKGLDCLYQ